MANLNYLTIVNTFGVDDAYLHSALGIPMRTLRSWRMGERTPPEYVLYLIQYFLIHDRVYKEGEF